MCPWWRLDLIVFFYLVNPVYPVKFFSVTSVAKLL